MKKKPVIFPLPALPSHSNALATLNGKIRMEKVIDAEELMLNNFSVMCGLDQTKFLRLNGSSKYDWKYLGLVRQNCDLKMRATY